MDYYPYGDIRLDEKSGTFSEQRKYAGHEYDADTGLSYMNARYYNGKIGRFVSEDPAYLLIGDQSFKDKYKRTLEMHLSDPQSLNSYSYVNNNPLKWTDPDGEILPVLVLAAWAVAEVGLSVYDAYDTATTLSNPNSSFTDKGLSAGGFVAGLVLPGGGYGKGAKEAVKNIGKVEGVVGKGIKMIKDGKDAFLRAAEHSDVRNHYPGKSVEEIENIARDTYKNFDIKVNIKGEKQYYYNSKTNDLFINNPKQPTVFPPGRGVQYLKDAVKRDIEKGGRVK